MILPGATLGMLGGGQLGRLFTAAAHELGYHVWVLDPDPDSPAGRIADHHLIAPYDDPDALARLGQACAVVTTEFENVPAGSLQRLARWCPVHPRAEAVRTTQNRIREKRFVQSLGLATAPFAVLETAADVAAAARAVRFPARLKRAELGYDGKGQQVVATAAELAAAFRALGEVPCVLEEQVDLARELSVVVARNGDGAMLAYPVTENVHRDGILHRSVAPAAVAPELAEAARAAAERCAAALDFIGVLAVEFFVDRAGRLLVNEIAPRTHNSGHWTLDGAVTSQFEQQVRMVCGLPFGSNAQHSAAVMINLLGDLWQDAPPHWPALLADADTKLHLYGKRAARPGRKMGHFTCLGPETGPLVERAEDLFARLRP